MNNNTIDYKKKQEKKEDSIFIEFLDYSQEGIKKFTNSIKDNMGEYENSNDLMNDIFRKIYGKSEKISADLNLPDSNTWVTLANAFKKAQNHIPFQKQIFCYVFPLFDKTASFDLDGVNAFVLNKNTIIFFIDTLNSKWENSLLETVFHEYAHLVYTSKYEWNNILEGIINEGIAEHFREEYCGGVISNWSNSLSQEQAEKELLSLDESMLQEVITSDNITLYTDFFFGSEKYKKWFGYSVGYWLISRVTNDGGYTTLDIFNFSPKEIYQIYKKIATS